jgi:hypothetical protein
MEPSILVNSTGMRWHHICLPTKSYFVVDVDDQAVVWCWCWVMLALALSRQCWLWFGVTAKSCWQWPYRGNLTLAWCCCWVMLAMALLKRLGRSVRSMPSHASNSATKVTWLQCDVDAESFWWWCCRVMLATALSRRLGCGTMLMLSHPGDGTATQGCTSYGKVTQLLSSGHQCVVIEWRSQIGMPIIIDIHVGA